MYTITQSVQGIDYSILMTWSYSRSIKARSHDGGRSGVGVDVCG